MDDGQLTGKEIEPEAGPHFVVEAEPAGLYAWEEIDVGRYMPRRIRGSNRGRALG